MTPFDGKCQNLQKTPTHFALAYTVSEILNFEIVDLQKVCQGHGVQFSAMTPLDGKCQNI